MSSADEIDELLEQAHAASDRQQKRHAALLYEQARRLAADSGQTALAYKIGVWASRAWSLAGDERRHLTLQLDLLHHIPADVDPWDVYEAKDLNFTYQIDLKADPDLDVITALANELDSLCASLGQPDSRDALSRKARIFRERGMYAEALGQYEIAWSRKNVYGESIYASAGRAAIMSIRLSKRADALRWLTHTVSKDYPDHARILVSYARLLIALHDSDSSAAKAALFALDDSMRGVERPWYSAEDTQVAVAALVLDGRLGDPLAPSHPCSLRLAEFPNQFNTPHFKSYQQLAAIYRQIAGLRYAAGIKPVDDLYYRKPQAVRRRSAARLPAEIAARVASARQACDDAMPVATLLDSAFRCTFRQDNINAMRGRIDEIAAVHRLGEECGP